MLFMYYFDLELIILATLEEKEKAKLAGTNLKVGYE